MDAMEAVERLEHLGTIYGPLKQKHVIKHVLNTKMYKLWIEDERYEMEVEPGGRVRVENEGTADETVVRDDSVDRDESAEARVEMKRKRDRWIAGMDMQREKSAEEMYRKDMYRAGDERAWEANERDAMETNDSRELYGNRRRRREGGIEGWRRKRKELTELRKHWTEFHSKRV